MCWRKRKKNDKVRHWKTKCLTDNFWERQKQDQRNSKWFNRGDLQQGICSLVYTALEQAMKVSTLNMTRIVRKKKIGYARPWLTVDIKEETKQKINKERPAIYEVCGLAVVCKTTTSYSISKTRKKTGLLSFFREFRIQVLDKTLANYLKAKPLTGIEIGRSR